MITRTKDSSFLANSSQKFFKIGLGLSILLVIGAFKLPLYSKVPVIEPLSFDEPGDVIVVTTILPIAKELPPEKPKPIVKSKTFTPVPKAPVPDDKPTPDPVIEQPAKTSVAANTTQMLMAPVEKKKPTLTIAEFMPEFKGGEAELMAYVGKNVHYPAMAIDIDLEGKVYVRFVVNKNGKISNVEIAKGIDPLLDNAAMEVIRNMPDWTPGMQNGEKVNVSMVLPINFVIR